MSLSFNKKKFLGLGAAAAVVAGIAFMPMSGANFSASDTGTVNIQTATLSLNLSDANGSDGTFALNYNVAPGQTVNQMITVQNTGSIDADAKISNMVPSLPAGLSATDFAKLKVGVNGVAPVPATSLPTSVSLGTVAAGETKTYNLSIGLDSSAGNEWQGKSIAVGATVTLSQK